ncbi:MAG: polyketide synthase, partial [Hyphomicrobiales bacterium]|nr:polyketide synthase [Hyphomicrobiales bacterium]
MSFAPVAIVGQGCVLPGALNPGALWEAVADGRDLTTPPPPGAWPVDPRKIIGSEGEIFRNGARPVPSRGGFVTGFDEIFEPAGFMIPDEDVVALDRSVQWLLEATRQAVHDANYEDLGGTKAAVVIGNNAYPTATLVEMANRVLIEEPLGLATLPPRDTAAGRRYWANRFSAGRPAHLIARAFAADGPAFCLDAACASSLYAAKLACDYLQEGTVDVALAGGLSGTDNIFLHLGFSEIQALSPSGMSRPFNRHADGLLPSEGAGVVVLKRLEDAVRDGNLIHAVIRGIGLSNDGRKGGLLAPDSHGQAAAMRRAYAVADIDPATISLLECHATGTSTGDRIELLSSHSVFDRVDDLPVGSLKSNLGHLITAAGMGGIIKVVGALASGLRPPTLHAEEPL